MGRAPLAADSMVTNGYKQRSREPNCQIPSYDQNSTRHWGEPYKASFIRFWGDAITRKIKDGRRRRCFSIDWILDFVLAQLDIEGNILTNT